MRHIVYVQYDDTPPIGGFFGFFAFDLFFIKGGEKI
jgi:hypothetical protein